MPLLDRLPSRLRVLAAEVTKFGTVGAAMFVLDVGLFNALLAGPLEGKPLTSKAVSTAVAATTSYALNRHWTWRHRRRTGVAREYALFVLLSAIGLGITEACLATSHYLLELDSVVADNVSANGFGLVLGMLFRFWSFKRFVFLAEHETEAADEAASVSVV